MDKANKLPLNRNTMKNQLIFENQQKIKFHDNKEKHTKNNARKYKKYCNKNDKTLNKKLN